ncbi:ABC transporter ATP-binding protein [Amycolatopsis rubida]|uniref:NitT/TauT family transport system ATP-binding protein n=1 Tax=Amycolatopsis rubida TaxID=112413 RepID=A0A1I5ZGJ4_9PSEU|nr:ABC transporter ATP-binding protein [Amycolatopsis rubida]SFQ55639.1 NitT/TauT family transport system ATP-binding protein [Amycolatopsis rubida]
MSSPVVSPARGDAIVLGGVRVEFAAPGGELNTVIDDLDLRVPAGQFVALIGRSGCGKTTLLNLVAGLVSQSSGEAAVLGGPPARARRRLGFMMARDALLPWRNARRNVEYGLELRGLPRKSRREIAMRWLDAVHLGRSDRLWPWQLSQGMRQRVALARTWALDPEILLMDEPFAALDAHTRVAVQHEFLNLWQEQERTVLFVTHDLTEAISLADRVVLLGNGRILDDVTVGLRRPRDLEAVRVDKRFAELYDRLQRRLNHLPEPLSGQED